MALALSWKDYVDTDLKFSEFFNSSHTVVVRFMPQWPNAYEGPMVAENGSGTFGVGLDDHNQGGEENWATRLYVAVGTYRLSMKATMKAATWHHLGLVVEVTATQRKFTLYLDGAPLPNQLTVPASAADLPQGTVRFGKRTTGKTVNEHDAQYYGLLDDVAVFGRALTAAQIGTLRTSVLHLTGTEADLLVGYTLNDGLLPAKLARPIVLRGAARKVITSASRNSAEDKALLPLPTHHQRMDLPFPPGEAWYINNGVGTPGNHHEGYATFCWDFTVAGKDSTAEYPNGTGGAPIYAAAPGTVLNVLEAQPTGTKEPNFVEIQQGPGEFAGYMHLRQNSVPVTAGSTVSLGQKAALIGSTGLAGCHDCNHLHFGVADKAAWTGAGWTDPSRFVTVPVAFSDYEVETSPGVWQSVARGMPQLSQVVRNPPTPKFGQRALRLASALARDGGLDVFATDLKGRVWVARWAPGEFARNWDRWRPVLDDIANQNAPVAAVARDADKLDIFVAGADGKTYTAAWEAGVASGTWRGWWNILTGAIPQSGTVSAVSRHPGQLDVFHVSTDGRVYTAAWATGQQWAGWWPIGTLKAQPGSPVAAVARDADKLDIFVAGADGKTYTAAWEAGGVWRGWWNILTGDLPAGGTVSAVSRHPGQLDVFRVGTDGRVFTAAWAAGQQWAGWWPIGTLKAQPGSPVAAVARDADKLDIFVAGADGKTYTAAWDAGVAGGAWRGWWNILTGTIAPGGTISAVSRNPGQLDVFRVGTDYNIYTAAWTAGQQWAGWWRIG